MIPGRECLCIPDAPPHPVGSRGCLYPAPEKTDSLRAQLLQARDRIADLTAERDALAEVVKRVRDLCDDVTDDVQGDDT